MRRTQLPISVLPAWSKLNDVVFYDISVEDIGNKGIGLVAARPITSEDTFDIPTVMRVPKNLILSAEAVEVYAKTDNHFRELLSAAGGVSTRGDIMLFLLMQITRTSLDGSLNIGVSTPWTEYISMLPSTVPVPTTWTEEQRLILTGTSLESALSAKISALEKEFNRLQESTTEISWCRQVWWDSEILTLSDWVLVDSWYRSRCVELPRAGHSIVPCLDLANHTVNANAYFEQAPNDDVLLLLRANQKVEDRQEITISYGEAKSAAEMLFSYGFVEDHSATNSLVLDLQHLSDGPLGKAKLAAFPGAPVARLWVESEAVQWYSPFLFFVCLNEEDGLQFKVLQQSDGSQGSLRVLWQGHDVTDSTDKFQEHISQHPMEEIFNLRVVILLQNRIGQQIERLHASEDISAALESDFGRDLWTAAAQLRRLETRLLEMAYDALDLQKSTLLQSPTVARYLGTAGESDDVTIATEDIGDDDDFS